MRISRGRERKGKGFVGGGGGGVFGDGVEGVLISRRYLLVLTTRFMVVPLIFFYGRTTWETSRIDTSR